eukprot:scaffold224529_cov31-Prasinocladus_malaysianus.AAC.1
MRADSDTCVAPAGCRTSAFDSCETTNPSQRLGYAPKDDPLRSNSIDKADDGLGTGSFITQATAIVGSMPTSRPLSSCRPRSSCGGPTRPASMRRPSENSVALPIAPESHHSDRSARPSSSPIEVSYAVKSALPRTPTGGRRRHTESQAANNSPTLPGNSCDTDPLAGLGENHIVKRVPSAGRRAPSS